MNNRWFWAGALCFGFVLLMVGPWACGPKHLCKIDSDCLRGQECRTDTKDGLKKCFPKLGDGSCDPACKDGETCQNGTCSTKVLSCEPACKDGQVCENGKCVTDGKEDSGAEGTGETIYSETVGGDDGGADGPGSECKFDDDCPGKAICDEGVCKMATPTCKVNRDCPSGYVCNNGTCEKFAGGDGGPEDMPEAANDEPPQEASPQEEPSQETPPEEPKEQRPDVPGAECYDNTECRAGWVCKDYKCLPKASVCSPDCAAGKTCLNGKCVAGVPKEMGDACSAKEPCGAGLVCLKVSSTRSYCFQSCKGSTDCAKNPLRKSCIQLVAGKTFCVETSKDGGICGFDRDVQGLCDKGLTCSQFSCQKPKEVKTFGKCGVNGLICPSGHRCVRFGNVTYGYCLKPCKVGGNDCASGSACEPLSGGSGACFPVGTGDSDEECGTQTGDNLDAKQICKPGLSCVNLGRSVCLKFWEGDCKTAGKTCASGRVCQGLKGGTKSFGACFSKCSSGKTCSRSYLQCRNDACWPTSP